LVKKKRANHERPSKINQCLEDPGHGASRGGVQAEIGRAYLPYLRAMKLKRLDEMGKLHCAPETGTRH